jgi:uncharacterized protein YqgC (DUF456 family)
VAAFLYKSLLILLYIFLAASVLSTAIGIPGNWILFGVACIIALVTHFSWISWPYLLLFLALAAAGEVVESFLGVAVVAKRGGSKLGAVGTFIGGFAGVIVGAPFIPPVGAVLLGFAGAFLGAVIGEYVAYKRLDTAVRVGFWALIGRALAIVVKVGLGCVIFWFILVRTWMQLSS